MLFIGVNYLNFHKGDNMSSLLQFFLVISSMSIVATDLDLLFAKIVWPTAWCIVNVIYLFFISMYLLFKEIE